MLCVERGTREILAGEYGDLRRGRSEGVRDEMTVAGGRGQKDEGTRTLAYNAVMLGRYRREVRSCRSGRWEYRHQAGPVMR